MGNLVERILKFSYNVCKKIQSEYNYIFRSERKFKMMIPTTFAIEVVLGCNLRCPECEIGNSHISRKKGMMTFTELKIIADKIKPFAKLVYLHLYGEPLLNKDIFLMIEYVSKFSSVNISTNGQLVNSEVAKKLILSGVTDIIVSIDGVTQDVYEKYRIGGDVVIAFNALKELVYYNQIYGNHVKILPQFIVFQHNEHQIDQFREICRSLGLKPFFKAPFIVNKSLFQRSSHHKYWREYFSNFEKYITALSKDCDSIRSVMTILLDGSIIPCCYDYQGAISFGNIFQQEVLEIWNNPTYYSFRYETYNGEISKFCTDNCLMFYYDEEYATGNDTL